MKSIFQEDEFGCGIACVAMLSGITYSQAKKRCGDRYRPGNGIENQQMLEILHEVGLKVIQRGRLSANSPVTDLTHNALLWGAQLPSRGKIVRDENTWNHWLVWDARARVVRDPYRYRKPVWLTKYLAVEIRK
jgi:hypothetical protein